MGSSVFASVIDEKKKIQYSFGINLDLGSCHFPTLYVMDWGPVGLQKFCTPARGLDTNGLHSTTCSEVNIHELVHIMVTTWLYYMCWRRVCILTTTVSSSVVGDKQIPRLHGEKHVATFNTFTRHCAELTLPEWPAFPHSVHSKYAHPSSHKDSLPGATRWPAYLTTLESPNSHC